MNTEQEPSRAADKQDPLVGVGIFHDSRRDICPKGGDHDWSGPGWQEGNEGGASCAKCGRRCDMDYILWSMP